MGHFELLKTWKWDILNFSNPVSGTFWASVSSQKGLFGVNLGSQILKVGLFELLKSWKWYILGFSKWSKSLIWSKSGLKIVNFWAWGNSGCCWHCDLGEIWLWEGGKVGFWAWKSKKFFSLECKTLRLWVLALNWGQLGIFLPKPEKNSKICLKKA